MSYISLESKAKREADLARMRERWQRNKHVMRPKGREPRLLKLTDLAYACRYAMRFSKNPSLHKHLELAASYFDDADSLVYPATTSSYLPGQEFDTGAESRGGKEDQNDKSG